MATQHLGYPRWRQALDPVFPFVSQFTILCFGELKLFVPNDLKAVTINGYTAAGMIGQQNNISKT